MRPLAALLGRPQFGGLWSQNCLNKEHVLGESMFYSTVSLTGGHVSWENMFSGGHIFQDNTSLKEDRFYMRICLIGGHKLHKSMSYWWTHLTGVYAF